MGSPKYSLQSKNSVFSKPDTTDFVFTYTQDIEIKDTSKVDTLYAFMDIYLQGCSENFRNTEPINVQFDLLNPIYLDKDESHSSLWIIFFLAFASGLIALLTPCVFPMIPMTVTFFTKQSKTKKEGMRKAMLYAFFIIIIYVLLGVLISGIFGAGALNAMATNAWVNLCFAILFIVFAISFLGAFEITLPSSWVNKADKQADKGGIVGIFFMAFTLALVSFSCTGPIVGSVLVKSAEGGEVIAPIIAMLGFSSALALPFGLFAAFPGWLNSLPQSGGWLNVVKVTLGLLEIAFAFKFLLQADQGFESYIISREIFIAVWVAVFLVLGIYLLGFIQFPHDSKVEKLSVGRSLFGLVSIAFVIYLLPGMWGAPVNIISGLAPSKSYSESPYGVNMAAPEKSADLPESAEYHGHGIWVIKDYDEALAYAKKVQKPLLIDFTGIQCVNCRKMEDFVWAKEDIAPIMAEKFVIASLFVDDKAALPKDKWVTLADGTVLKEVGEKWFNFQTSRYAQGTQPLYVVVDHNEKNISGKASYDTHNDPADFKKWLDNALLQFEFSMNPNVAIPEFEIVDGQASVSDKKEPMVYNVIHGIKTICNYDTALAFAKKSGKPLLLNFSGFYCKNARKFEDQIWEKVSGLLTKFVVATLYCDDKSVLPKNETGVIMSNGKEIKTVGDKWLNMQITRYKRGAQPLYAVLDHNENDISDGLASFETHGDPEVFAKWLQSALDKFESIG